MPYTDPLRPPLLKEVSNIWIIVPACIFRAQSNELGSNPSEATCDESFSGLTKSRAIPVTVGIMPADKTDACIFPSRATTSTTRPSSCMSHSAAVAWRFRHQNMRTGSLGQISVCSIKVRRGLPGIVRARFRNDCGTFADCDHISTGLRHTCHIGIADVEGGIFPGTHDGRIQGTFVDQRALRFGRFASHPTEHRHSTFARHIRKPADSWGNPIQLIG